MRLKITVYRLFLPILFTLNIFARFVEVPKLKRFIKTKKEIGFISEFLWAKKKLHYFLIFKPELFYFMELGA